MQSQLNMCLFGSVRLHSDERRVEQFKTSKSRDLLAFLALFPNRPHERPLLQRMLWPEVDPLKSQNRLSVTLYLLRQQLEESGITPDDVLDATRDTLGLQPGAVTTDYHDLVRLSNEARQGGPGAERAYKRIVSLYAGPLLGATPPSWCDALRVDAEIRLQEAVVYLADQVRAPEDPRAVLHRFLEVDPLSDRARATLLDWLVNRQAHHEAYSYAVQFAFDARRARRELGPLLKDSVEKALAFRPAAQHDGITSVCTVQGVNEQKLDQVCESFQAYRPSGGTIYVPDPLIAHRLAQRVLSVEPQSAIVIKTFIGRPGSEPATNPKREPGKALADLPSAALLKTNNSSYVTEAVGSGFYSLAFS